MTIKKEVKIISRNEDSVEGVIKLYKDNNELFTAEDLQEIDKQMRNKLSGNRLNKYCIRVNSPAGLCFTPKSFAGELDFNMVDDYFQGMVQDPRKFNEFFSIQIIYNMME